MILRRDPAIKVGYDDAGWIGGPRILSHTLWQLTAVNRRADRFTHQEVIEWGLVQVQVEHDGVACRKPRLIVLWILPGKRGIVVRVPTDTDPVELAIDHIRNGSRVVFDRGDLDRLNLRLRAPVIGIYRDR